MSEDHTRKKRFLLGCAAGLTSAITLQPLDVLKTTLQGNVLRNKNETLSSTRIIPQIKSFIRKSGVKGLWKGATPSAARSTLGPGFYFLMLEEFNAFSPESSGLRSLFFGSTARFIGGILVCPLTVVKTRLEWDQTSTFRTVRAIYSEAGIRGFFAGLGPTLLRDVPQAGIHLFLFRKSKSYMTMAFGENRLNSMTSALVAGALATAVTMPFDVIKTQYQIGSSGKAVGVIPLLRLIWNTKGAAGFFSGFSTRLIRKPLQTTVTWGIYDAFR